MTAVAIIPRGHRHPARVSQFLQHIVSWPASKSQGGGVAGLHGGPDLYGPFDAQPPSWGATGSAPRAPALHEEQPQSEGKSQGFHRPTRKTRSSGPFLKLRHPFSTACNVGRSSDFRNGPHGPAGSGPEHTFSKSLGQEAVARMAHLAVDVYRSQERTRGRLLSTALRFPRRSFTLPSKVIAIFAYRRQQAGARSSQQQPLDLIFYFYHFYPRAAARGMARGGAAAIH